MAEQNEEKLHIKLHVYNRDIDVYVNRSEEAYYRRAAKLITERYNTYAGKYKGRMDDSLLYIYVLIDIALRYEMEHDKNDTQKSNDILRKLTAMIDDALGNNVKKESGN